MCRLRTKRMRLLMTLLALVPARAWAAAAGGGEAIVFVADSRKYSGWLAWFSNLYNESLLYFTLVTILIVPSMGAVLGQLTGAIMARMGINLKSRVLAEH